MLKLFTHKLSLITFLLLITVPFSAFAKNKAAGMPPPVVSAAPVQMKIWQTKIDAVGTLSANQGVTIKPNVDGRVVAVYFRSGDYVKAGAPLIQLYPDILKAQLASAQAQVTLTHANYERALTLFKKHVFAQADLDNALAQYKSNLANAANLQAQLDQTLIRAPFNGRLGLRLVNVGDFVKAGTTAISSLENIDPLRIDFSVPESYLSQLKLGQAVKVFSRSYPDTPFTGTVYAFDSTIDPDTRTLGIRAILPNNPPKLLPGAFVDIKLITASAQKYITIPQTAISFAADGYYVYKIVKGKAFRVKVATGMRRDDEIAILSGLQPNDTVITAGQLKISQDGMPVIIGK